MKFDISMHSYNLMSFREVIFHEKIHVDKTELWIELRGNMYSDFS